MKRQLTAWIGYLEILVRFARLRRRGVGGVIGMELAQAELAQISGIALVQKMEWRVGLSNFVGTAFHIFGVILRAGHQ